MVIADIRPIFDDTAVVSYTLRLEYTASKESFDVSIALDQEDLLKLRDQQQSLALSIRSSMSTGFTFAFVGHAQQLDRDSETDQALDVIFDAMDDAFLDGNFSFVDDALERFNIGKCSVALLVGILTVTGPARSKLTKRKKFRDLVETSFRDRGRYDERLLRGL